ncbi:MAG TPA: tetratricopeptide repeat protein, partial [Ramlibacter sp.]
AAGAGFGPSMSAMRALVAAGSLAVVLSTAAAVESDPLPVPAQGAAALAAGLYNEGVALLLARRFAEAQARFEAALDHDERLAEAHNNLAYALRMQGAHNFERSLQHYDRAIALKPGLAQAYMYRGVLLSQRGEWARARQDLEQLRRLDAKLAEDLERVLAGRQQPYRSGIAGQYD